MSSRATSRTSSASTKATKGAPAPEPAADPTSEAFVDEVTDKVTAKLGDVVQQQVLAALAAAGLGGQPTAGGPAGGRPITPPKGGLLGGKPPDSAGGSAVGLSPPPDSRPRQQRTGTSKPAADPAAYAAQFGGTEEAAAAALAQQQAAALAASAPSFLSGSPVGQSGLFGQQDPIPHQDLAYNTPGRIVRQQGLGIRVQTDLWTLAEYENKIAGFSLLGPASQSELAYAVVADKRLDDVLLYIEGVSRGEAALDIHRLHGGLSEIRDLSGERTDGVVRLGTIKAKLGEEHETDKSQLAAMSLKQRQRMLSAGRNPQYLNRYEQDAVKLQTAVDKRVETLIAAPHAYAQIKSRYGAAAAQKAMGWAIPGTPSGGGGGGGGADEGG